MRMRLVLCSALACVCAVSAAAQSRVVGLTVTLTDTRATASRASVATGSLTVTIVNKGTKPRVFTFAGARKSVAAGGKATFHVVLTPGAFTFTALGKPKTLKGVVTATPVVASGQVTTTTPSSSSNSVLASCPKPVTSTVNVTLDDGKFTFSPAVAQCGTVTFALTNVGKNNHSLYLESSGAQSGALAPGQSERLTVPLGPGSVTWVDGVYETDLGGDAGTLTVSG